jgi:predicted glutamine amidotransferase
LLEQTCPSGEHQLSGGVKIDSPRQKIAMAASVPLTDDGWEPMEAGLVVALKNGKIVRYE